MRTQRHRRYTQLASIAVGICCFLAVITSAQAEVRHVIYEGFVSAPSIGDLDGDDDIDIFLGLPLGWFENDGSGSFSQRTLPNPGGISEESAIQDIDNDGDLDLITCRTNFNVVNLHLWENDGSGSFTARTFTHTDLNIQGQEFLAADFDNDGDADVFMTFSDSYIYNDLPIQPLYFENIGNWDFTAHHLDYEYPFRSPACIADFNNDDLLDVAVCKREYTEWHESEYEIIIFENNGFPFFTERGIDVDSLLYGYGMDCADVDSDGRVDLAYSGGSPGGIQNTYVFQATNINWNYSMGVVHEYGLGPVHICDYDLDGFLDIAMGSGWWNDDWDLIVLLGDGNGTFPTIKDDIIGASLFGVGDVIL